MKLVVHEFLSVDGVMQGPGAVEEDRTNGFDRGGWIVPFASAEGWGQIVDGWFRTVDTFLLGRRTFEMMRDHWSSVTDPDDPVAAKLNTLPKIVVTSTLTEPGWANATTLDGGMVLAEIAKLKARAGGELQIHGSWQLAATLHEAGLVDEYRLLVFPTAVGTGKRLFTDHAPATGFTVADSRIVDDGTVYLALRPAPYRTGGVTIVDGKSVLTDG